VNVAVETGVCVGIGVTTRVGAEVGVTVAVAQAANSRAGINNRRQSLIYIGPF
jgi:hypothetical protein